MELKSDDLLVKVMNETLISTALFNDTHYLTINNQSIPLTDSTTIATLVQEFCKTLPTGILHLIAIIASLTLLSWIVEIVGKKMKNELVETVGQRLMLVPQLLTIFLFFYLIDLGYFF